jgi:CubicO group peptidase (beta-lactamase class C family)
MVQSLLCALLLLQTPAPAAIAPSDVSELLAGILTKRDVPGLVALALRGDEIIGKGAAGLRQRGASDKITFEDKFHLGSCTKAMTATLAAILVEEGKLKWNTRLFEVFPAFEAQAAPGWKDETLRDLLLNRGGLPAELDADGLWGKLWTARGSPQDQRLVLLEGVLKHPPLSPPGTTFLYSNANFAVAGAMTETIGGKPYEELLALKLFQPLGMQSAGFGPPGGESGLDQPHGHDAQGKPIAAPGHADNPESITPAGRVHCTISDWSKFVALHLAGARLVRGLGPEPRTKLLSKQSFELLQTSPEGPDKGYAMGWGVTQRPWGGNLLVHSGSNTLWYCMVWIAPEKNFAAMACCNQGGEAAQTACDEAVGGLITRLLAPAK